MFATSARGRQHQLQQYQRESPPEPGCDSSYGIRSLNGSVEWTSEAEESVSGETTAYDEDTASSFSSSDPTAMPQMSDGDGEEEVTVDCNVTPLITQSRLDLSEHKSQPEPDLESRTESEQSPDISSSPEDTCRPTHPSPRQSLDLLPDLEGPSEPSSPASFTSLPSYVASLSSLSRMSSPIAGIDSDGYGDEGLVRAQGLEGMEGLVLPMLDLPHESLHASAFGLKRTRVGQNDGSGEVVIAILGEAEVVDGLLEQLRRSGEEVNKADGEVMILRNGRASARLIVGVDADQVSILSVFNRSFTHDE